MKYQIMIEMLFLLLARRKVTASELAARFSISQRSVYRYVEEMTVSGVPIDVARGAGGGIYISDAYKLPRGFFTREEYARTLGAMQAMDSELGDPVLASAIKKLTAQMKTERRDAALSGNILVDSGAWGSERRFSDKLALVERATDEQETLEIDYVDRGGERTHRIILPHLLVYKQNIWYVYAFCRTRNAFRLFKIGRMRSIVKTGTRFNRIPFRREDIPLSFWTAEASVEARFLLTEEALPFAEEWLGVEAVYEKDGKRYAEATLPDDESLVGKILSAGAGFTVLAPASLAERVKREADKIAASYHTV